MTGVGMGTQMTALRFQTGGGLVGGWGVGGFMHPKSPFWHITCTVYFNMKIFCHMIWNTGAFIYTPENQNDIYKEFVHHMCTNNQNTVLCCHQHGQYNYSAHV